MTWKKSYYLKHDLIFLDFAKNMVIWLVFGIGRNIRAKNYKHFCVIWKL